MTRRTLSRRLAACLPLLAATLATGCDSLSPNRMKGCYSERNGGAPFLRVVAENGAYYASSRGENVWTDSTLLASTNPATLGQLFGTDTAGIAEALVARDSPFGIFRVKAGATVRNKDSASEYIAVVLFGAIPVFKVPCA